jgi:hypothetical protein
MTFLSACNYRSVAIEWDSLLLKFVGSESHAYVAYGLQ